LGDKFSGQLLLEAEFWSLIVAAATLPVPAMLGFLTAQEKSQQRGDLRK